MTEIDKPGAGRELDALVAERVMGWTDVAESAEVIRCVLYRRWFGRPPGEYDADWWTEDGRTFIPSYSFYIERGWEVLDWLEEDWFVVLSGSSQSGLWECYLIARTIVKQEVTGCADTPTLAICRAALRTAATNGNISPRVEAE